MPSATLFSASLNDGEGSYKASASIADVEQEHFAYQRGTFGITSAGKDTEGIFEELACNFF